MSVTEPSDQTEPIAAGRLLVASSDDVLSHVRSSAEKSGRVFAVCYDLSGASKDRLYDLLVGDGKRLVDEENDWYLRLIGEGTKVIQGERKAGATLTKKRFEGNFEARST